MIMEAFSSLNATFAYFKATQNYGIFRKKSLKMHLFEMIMCGWSQQITFTYEYHPG